MRRVNDIHKECSDFLAQQKARTNTIRNLKFSQRETTSSLDVFIQWNKHNISIENKNECNEYTCMWCINNGDEKIKKQIPYTKNTN